MASVFIGLGSNLANPPQQLQAAFNALSTAPDIIFLQQSSLYRSGPWGDVQNQPDFFNAVAKISTSLDPNDLLSFLQHIEKQQQRDRSGPRWGARTLDLDILLFDQLELNSPQLTIPHLYLTERAFVVYPLVEIAPHLILPNGESIQSVKSRCNAQGLTRVVKEHEKDSVISGDI